MRGPWIAITVLVASVAGDSAWAETPPRQSGIPAAVYEGDGRPLVARTPCLAAPTATVRPSCCRDALVRDPLFCIPGVDPAIRRLQERRDDWPLQVHVGAYHWWNHQLRTGEWTYGYPADFQGTYYYYARFDAGFDVCFGPVRRAGAHVELQWRDQGKFRRFYRSSTWLYETYGWLEFEDAGTLKVGQVWRRFGIDSEGTFWGHTPYYNGQNQDPDLMASWEATWKRSERFAVDTFVQVLFGEDGVNGSLTGGDAESSSLYDEGLGIGLRAVPTWTAGDTTLALGASFFTQQIESKVDDDEVEYGAALDATFEWCGFKAFAAYYGLWGTVNEAHYITGGPTNEKHLGTVGMGWSLGSLTPRVSYSYADYRNPDGWESIWIAGFDLNLTSWLVFTLEYVHHTASGPALAGTLEEGLQVVLNWNF